MTFVPLFDVRHADPELLLFVLPSSLPFPTGPLTAIGATPSLRHLFRTLGEMS